MEPSDLESEQTTVEENFDNPDFLASLEGKNTLEPQTNDSFKAGGSISSNSTPNIAPGVTSSAPPVGAIGAGPPSLNASTFEGINENEGRNLPPDVALARPAIIM